MKEIIWKSQEAEIASGGKSSKKWNATGINIDSRLVEKGDLFIALTIGKTDGHSHIKAAFENGAAAALVSKIPDDLGAEYPILLVDNTQAALENMARYRRAKTSAKIIAITGSVGKTSVKDAIFEVLKRQGKAHKTQGNYNNFLGLPITLCRMSEATEYGIFELGMNHSGEIRELTKMLKPDIAIVTAIEAVHMEFFNSVEEIVDAKSEIFEGLGENGVAIIPFDSVYYEQLLKNYNSFGAGKVVSFGEGDSADIHLIERKINDCNQLLIVNILDRELNYSLPLKAKHNALNSLAVLGAIDVAGADIEKAAANLAKLEPSEGRGRIYDIKIANKNIRLIDDSYNASPASMGAAFENLSSFKERKIAVLGDMLELGAGEIEFHKSLKKSLAKNKINKVFATGKLMKHLYDILPCEMRAGYCKNTMDVVPMIEEETKENDIILVKGSHGSNMWKLAAELKKET